MSEADSNLLTSYSSPYVKDINSSGNTSTGTEEMNTANVNSATFATSVENDAIEEPINEATNDSVHDSRTNLIEVDNDIETLIDKRESIPIEADEDAVYGPPQGHDSNPIDVALKLSVDGTTDSPIDEVTDNPITKATSNSIDKVADYSDDSIKESIQKLVFNSVGRYVVKDRTGHARGTLIDSNAVGSVDGDADRSVDGDADSPIDDDTNNFDAAGSPIDDDVDSSVDDVVESPFDDDKDGPVNDDSDIPSDGGVVNPVANSIEPLLNDVEHSINVVVKKSTTTSTLNVGTTVNGTLPASSIDSLLKTAVTGVVSEKILADIEGQEPLPVEVSTLVTSIHNSVDSLVDLTGESSFVTAADNSFDTNADDPNETADGDSIVVVAPIILATSVGKTSVYTTKNSHSSAAELLGTVNYEFSKATIGNGLGAHNETSINGCMVELLCKESRYTSNSHFNFITRFCNNSNELPNSNLDLNADLSID
ncbi:hypothetical protein FOB58_005707 [Candida parapsilosis]|uniref:Uncharacterized protein n=2 Tax=Candida parapsilosis TaxID=5480 RepID=G8BKD6_CANPC|nr:uncharacterized protein CPAR2_702130 [Candida parapsilosis]KAF6042224.1 hypothetical protein FOB58_005707 [Candida parapsilosis]KAF6042503.1 hypothetical protein FOB59_005685 [Candida parapsilosis]KAF6042948.1 hypothetical protein FOB60_005702 [Candida parapsilosis]KAF6058043.1 hypothetical protein FOB61_005632 [Candida parapsilosis]KAI5909887.1 hypothetical protein K4G61_g3575 [Candida parapsilosis]